jgi:hypothetical protein
MPAHQLMGIHHIKFAVSESGALFAQTVEKASMV